MTAFLGLARHLSHSAESVDAATIISQVRPEPESSGYESGIVQLPSGMWRIRTARITPTKPGAFVAVWRRTEMGATEPFDETDPCMGLLVFVADGPHAGAFAFTREHLIALKVLRSAHSPGKRGFRVYPSWCTELNAQARKSQAQQAPAFTEYADPRATRD